MVRSDLERSALYDDERDLASSTVPTEWLRVARCSSVGKAHQLSLGLTASLRRGNIAAAVLIFAIETTSRIAVAMPHAPASIQCMYRASNGIRAYPRIHEWRHPEKSCFICGTDRLSSFHCTFRFCTSFKSAPHLRDRRRKPVLPEV